LKNTEHAYNNNVIININITIIIWHHYHWYNGTHLPRVWSIYRCVAYIERIPLTKAYTMMCRPYIAKPVTQLSRLKADTRWQSSFPAWVSNSYRRWQLIRRQTLKPCTESPCPQEKGAKNEDHVGCMSNCGTTMQWNELFRGRMRPSALMYGRAALSLHRSTIIFIVYSRCIGCNPWMDILVASVCAIFKQWTGELIDDWSTSQTYETRLSP